MKSPRPSFTASLALSPMKKELLLKVPKRIQLVNPPQMYTYLFAFHYWGGGAGILPISLQTGEGNYCMYDSILFYLHVPQLLCTFILWVG